MMHEVVFFDDIIEFFSQKRPIRKLPDGVKIVFSFKGSVTIPTFKVVHYKNEAYIWFRGTKLNSINDIIIDLTIGETDFLGGQCHKGYLDGTRNALSIAMPYIMNKERIVTLGHSLGGACASVAAMIMKYELGWKNIHCMTLACPGIVSKDLAEKTKDFITTFVRKNDPIPRIFRAKRGVYAALNLFKKKDIEENKFKMTSADTVPGRIIMLDEDKEGNPITRRPVESDFEIKANNAVSFIAHCQRLYLRDINYIYGVKVDEKQTKKDIKEAEKALKKFKREVTEYSIKKKSSYIAVIIGFIAWHILSLVLGPLGVAIGAVIALGILLIKYISRRMHRVQIYGDEQQDINEPLMVTA